MKELLHTTTAYRSVRSDAERGERPHAALVVFPDEKYLRSLLTECAKAFFLAEAGSREEKLIAEEHFSDCLFFPEAGGKLTVESAGRIVEESVLRPVEGSKKLFVLDGFHTVTPLVQNKLLKILEEPPEGVYFLLGATNEYSVLPTVRSRVKALLVPPFAEESVAAALRRQGHTAGVEEAAAACGGVLSVAESLLAGGGEDFRLAEQFLAGQDIEKFCRELSGDAKPFLAAVRLVLRDVMLITSGQAKYAARKNQETQRLAKRYSAGAAIASLALVEKAEREIGFHANFPQCALALAIGLEKEREKWQRLS